MTSHEILKADVLDILFDNRNKMYGAYVLRRYYNNRLSIALGIMLGALMIALIVLQKPAEGRQASARPFIDTVRLIALPNDPVKPKLPYMPRAATPPVKQIKSTNRIELVSDDVKPDMPSVEDIVKAAVSTTTIDGPELIGARQPDLTPKENGNTSGAKGAAKPEKDFTAIQKAAEFPGGQSAWMAFLSKYLRTPDELEAGQKRTVYVRFVVDTDGSISKFEIAQSGGAAFDNEVIRVLKKMPKWTPAFQKGHNVSVIFTQPVTFMALED